MRCSGAPPVGVLSSLHPTTRPPPTPLETPTYGLATRHRTNRPRTTRHPRIHRTPMKPCLTCGTPTPNTRCPQHTKPKQHRNHKDENQRRQILKHWIDTHGMTCPGTIWCNKPNEPHPVPHGHLTVDHTTPQAHGGTLHHGYTIMCRPANSRKGTQ